MIVLVHLGKLLIVRFSEPAHAGNVDDEKALSASECLEIANVTRNILHFVAEKGCEFGVHGKII